MPKPPTGHELADRLCKKLPGSPTRTIAKRLYEENRERFPNLESARKAVLRVRGANGSRMRKYASAGRPHQSSGWKPELPPSASDPWVPFQIDGPCRVLSLSDAHIPYHDSGAIEQSVKKAKQRHRPDVVLINGDWADFYRISRWEKDPKKRLFKDELNDIKQSLRWLRKRFPKARIIYKLGNHEERLDKYVWNRAPEFCDLDHVQIHTLLDFEKFGIERVDRVPVMCGKLPVLHGHELPKGLTNPVNQARGAFLRTIHTNLTAHGHRPSTHPEPDMWHKPIVTWSQGCLCNLRPEYMQFNKWIWGFAAIDVFKDNTFEVHNYQLDQHYVARAA